MKDTHEFFGMLGKFKVGRVQALRLVGEEFARELPPRALRSALEAASADGTPIMIFVGSGGCIQIHTGPINAPGRDARLVQRARSRLQPAPARGGRGARLLGAQADRRRRRHLDRGVLTIAIATSC